jgi:hypothetical protein
VRHEAAVLAPAAREHLGRREAARRAGEQRVGGRNLLDRLEQLLLREGILGDGLDHPVGVLHRLEQAAGLHELEQAALHDSLGGALQRHERPGAARHLRGGTLQPAGARVEHRHRPAGGRAQRGPAAADVPGADHGDLAR